MTGEIESSGIVYLKGGEEKTVRTVTFKINASSSGIIMLGVGNIGLDKETAFFFSTYKLI